jgi:MFS family permease
MNLGGALGFGIGAGLGSAYGWRAAFLACGAPGIVIALLVMKLQNPERGINDNNDDAQHHHLHSHQHNHGETREGRTAVSSHSRGSSSHSTQSSSTQDSFEKDMSINGCRIIRQKLLAELKVFMSEMGEILANKHFTLCVLGYAANCFAGGAMADWFPVFLLRYCKASVAEAGLVVGAATIVGGIGGNILGAKISDYFLHRVKSAYFLIPALFTIPTGL